MPALLPVLVKPAATPAPVRPVAAPGTMIEVIIGEAVVRIHAEVDAAAQARPAKPALNLADLPNDIDALKALLLAQQDVVAGLTEQLNTRAIEIEHLKLQIAKLRRMQFGRKSEKLDHQIEQLELQLEDLQTDEGEAAPTAAASVPPRSTR